MRGPALKKLVLPLFEEFVGRTPGSRVELKEAAIAWHYLLDGHPYAMLHGNRVIEVRHKNVNKGHALRHILERHRATDFVFCAGDVNFPRFRGQRDYALPGCICERSSNSTGLR